MRGSVVSRTNSQIRVAFPELFDIVVGSWRLDIGHSNIIYERMRTAINHLCQNPLTHERSSSSTTQLILQGTHLRDILLRTFSHLENSPHTTNLSSYTDQTEGKRYSISKDDMRMHSWAKRHMALNPMPIEGDPIFEGLNATQLRAVAMMVGERFSLVQGPPGTGKTKTLVETIKLLKGHFEVPQHILVCSYTNIAVDNLVRGLAKRGLKPLRVGYGLQTKSSLTEYSLETKLDMHPLRAKADELSKEEESLKTRIDYLQQRLRALMQKGLQTRQYSMHSALAGLERRLVATSSKKYAIRQEMLQDIITQADVICTTCITSASVALNVIDFPVVFLDEASMSTEPASLIPLMKGSQHVALVGDHKQLPPIITSREAQVSGLGTSLFERLIEEKGWSS
jgi:DNA polymerase III delta prime subunit